MSSSPIVAARRAQPGLLREGPGLRKWGRAREKRPPQVLDIGSPLSGATEKPYLVEEAVSYNELDYVSVS